MPYYVAGGKKLRLLVVCGGLVLLLLVGTGCFAVHRATVAAMTQARELPIYSVETEQKEKKLSLGINCAWGAEDIPDILSILEQEKIRATFFVVGDWVEKNADAVKLIDEKGHEIGNHSDTHPDMITLSESEIIEEIENCSAKVEQITGKKPTLFRPPSGSYHNRLISTAKSLGYFPIQWSLDSLDWQGKTVSEMKERILPKLTYGDILLFHNDTDHTAEALRKLIPAIQEKGYTFVTVGELIYQEDYHIDGTGRQYRN